MEDGALPPTPSAALRPLTGTLFTVSLVPLREGDGHALSILNSATGCAFQSVSPFPAPGVAVRAVGTPENRHEACLAGMHAWAAHVLPRVAPGRVSFVARPPRADTILRRPEGPLPPLGAVVLPLLFGQPDLWPPGGRIQWTLRFAQPANAIVTAAIRLYGADRRYDSMLPAGHALTAALEGAATTWWTRASTWFAGVDTVEITGALPEPTAHQRMAAHRAVFDGQSGSEGGSPDALSN